MPAYRTHPQMTALNAEIHARPPVPLEAPSLVSCIAFLHEAGGTAATEIAHIGRLMPVPEGEVGESHLLLRDRALTLKWERHNEFSTYTLVRPLTRRDRSDATALEGLPTEWLADVPGAVIVATHIRLLAGSDADAEALFARIGEAGDSVVMSRIAEGAAWVLTDFRLHDGATRFTVFDQGLSRWRNRRTVQRLLEIEVYRMMALLAFPVAKDVGRMLGRAEAALAELIDRAAGAATPDEERVVLGELTRLAAEVENSLARTSFRFGAAAAYYRLLQQRMDEIKEVRVQGNPTIRGFMERRLAPALNTCTAVANRQDELSRRIARYSQLLRARVDIELERQHQQVLAQMNRRAKLQLRLQETVEGLSVVAITYYGSQLVHYLAQGVEHWLPRALSPALITALAIPVVALIVARRVHALRVRLTSDDTSTGG